MVSALAMRLMARQSSAAGISQGPLRCCQPASPAVTNSLNKAENVIWLQTVYTLRSAGENQK